MKFLLQGSINTDKELKTVVCYCIKNNIPYRVSNPHHDTLDEDEIPVGYLDWFQKISGITADPPEYYPEFLSSLLGRNVWKTDTWPLGQKVFIKPADRAKRFNGFVTTGGYRGKKKGPYWCSDIVAFVNEWRYYVADGKVLAGYWYDGINDNTPAPLFPDIQISDGWCGSIDLGATSDNRLLLVEAAMPFSTGWYGNIGDDTYVNWLVSGYKWMKQIANIQKIIIEEKS